MGDFAAWAGSRRGSLATASGGDTWRTQVTEPSNPALKRTSLTLGRLALRWAATLYAHR